MDKPKFLNIKDEDLKSLIDFQASKMVGKVLKRFEIHSDLPQIKNSVKELIYEGWRDFKEILEAYSKGLGVTIFQFKSKKESE